MNLKTLRLNGEEARKYADDIAHLRLRVFNDFPYLYEGTLEYEKKYLETYFKAKHSFILLLKDGDQFIGATTGIWAQEEEESFRQPFVAQGIDPKQVFYFGESVLLPEYRGKGLGKVFFEEREAFARSLGFIEWLAFCAVVREENHPLRPKAFRPLNEFWISQGFSKSPSLKTTYEWQDKDQNEVTKKNMEYWLKKI